MGAGAEAVEGAAMASAAVVAAFSVGAVGKALAGAVGETDILGTWAGAAGAVAAVVAADAVFACGDTDTLI